MLLPHVQSVEVAEPARVWVAVTREPHHGHRSAPHPREVLTRKISGVATCHCQPDEYMEDVFHAPNGPELTGADPHSKEYSSRETVTRGSVRCSDELGVHRDTEAAANVTAPLNVPVPPPESVGGHRLNRAIHTSKPGSSKIRRFVAATPGCETGKRTGCHQQQRRVRRHVIDAADFRESLQMCDRTHGTRAVWPSTRKPARARLPCLPQ